MTTSVTEKCPRDFINETLIGEIGAIVNGKEKHDYLSYLLISCGIEFLGKCTAPIKTNWQDHKENGYYFKKGLALFPNTYNEPGIPDTLYSGLRCGICHALLPKNIIMVSSTSSQDFSSTPICLNILTFYEDFKNACEKLLQDAAYQGRLSEPFMAISNGTTADTINFKTNSI